MDNAKLIRVEIEESDSVFGTAPKTYTVWPIYLINDEIEDRGCGMSMGGRSLAERLKAAIEAGKTHYPVSVKFRVDGTKYVHAEIHAIGKHLSFDLGRLGF